MDIKAASRVSQRSVYDQQQPFKGPVNNVCSFWLAGRCNRNPCRFLHTDSQPPKQSRSRTWQRSPDDNVKTVTSSISQPKTTTITTTTKLVCNYWLSGNCVHGENCKSLHSWFCGSGFSMLAKLQGHNKAVTGIALPSASHKLYSSSLDKTVRVWDCNSGQCLGVVNFSCEVSSLMSEGPWVFVGLENSIKAWNIETRSDLTLTGPTGKVNTMFERDNMLFAGTQDGTIFVWKFTSQTNDNNSPELVATMKGHIRAVVSLVTGADNRLYSGSMDNTIKVWDLNTFQCVQTLIGHTSVVMSVLCWDNYLLSCSLDGTIKAWAATETGDLEVIYTREEEDGVLGLCGIHDSEEKPILLCSCNDDTVRLYDLPSFTERGRLFSKKEVRAIQIGTAGLFFTGDATGQLAVWKLDGEPSSATS